MMDVCFVDRIGAHSIWRLMNSIASEVIRNHGRVAYVRWDDGRQLEPLPAPAGVVIHDIMVSPKRFPWDVIRQQREFCEGLAGCLSRSRPDVVHTNFCLPGSATRRLVKQKFDIPVITTCHELFGSMNVYLRREVRRTEWFADRIVYISQTVAKSYGASLDEHNRPASPREQIIYNGLDTESIRALATSSPSRSKGLIVSAGRLVAEKGHAQVIWAMPDLLEEFPDLRFRLIGEGPKRESLRLLAERLGVGSKVELPGWLPYERTLQEMAGASVVVMPSRPVQEGFGLALVEAMCCGTRVVASEIPVFLEVAGRESKSVSFFRDGDVPSLVACLRLALRQSDDGRQAGADDYQSVKERYSAPQMAEQYVHVYAKLTT
jgi:glycosyltransferase involved in cell wall biosynthesis